ncbi:hypothetical protein [Limnospira platensis]
MQLDKHLPSDSRKCDRLSPRKCIPVAFRKCDRILPESDRIVESG